MLGEERCHKGRVGRKEELDIWAPEMGKGVRPHGKCYEGGSTHCASGTQPFTIGNVGQGRVQAVDVVGRRAGVTAEQFPPILADSTEFHVVIILLFRISPNLF